MTKYHSGKITLHRHCAWNNAVSRRHGFSPYFLFHGREVRHAIKNFIRIREQEGDDGLDFDSFVKKTQRALQEAWSIAEERAEEYALNMKKAHDKRTSDITIHVGAIVRHRHSGPWKPKLSNERYQERWKVIQKFPTSNAVEIRSEVTGKRKYINISYLVGALDNERDMANPKVHNFQGPTEAADWNKAPVVWKIGAHDNGQRCLWELFAGTRSMSQAAADRGWNVLAFENDP